MFLKVLPIYLLFTLSKSPGASAVLPASVIGERLSDVSDTLLDNPGKELNKSNRDTNSEKTPDANCGTVLSDGESLIIGGQNAKIRELPWYAGIYAKTYQPYKQLCGGSLVKNNVVISVAHCFWSDSNIKPAADYAVAVGKIYRSWNEDRDQNSQKSDIKDVHIPERFRGAATNYQDDIAIVVVETNFVFTTFVRPVCLNFDTSFDSAQLQPGKQGKVVSWNIRENSASDKVMKVAELPYISLQQCISSSPSGFREFITADKFCAGFNEGTALCKGDTGGGLSFSEVEQGKVRYYLRGIASTAPAGGDSLCSSVVGFTHILKHEQLIKKYL